MTDVADWQEHYDRQRAAHQGSGRIAGATGIASFCSCGLAFWAPTAAEADNQLEAHRCHERGERMTSRLIFDPVR